MARQFACYSGRTIPVLVKVVDGADIVKTTASNVVTAGRVGTRHDP